MSTSLNLYATKVFEEHPLSLWPLDEDAGYISLQSFSPSPVAGATQIPAMAFKPPRLPSGQHGPEYEMYQGDSGSSEFWGQDVYGYQINYDMRSVSLGLYIYVPDRSVNVIGGISYKTAEMQDAEVIKATRVDPVVTVPGRTRKMWAFVSFTFEVPDNFNVMTPFFEIKYAESEVPFEFALHGFSFGQWAEEFSATSPGISPIELPTGLSLGPGVKAIAAQPYGLQGDPGYYIVKDNYLLAKNTGMPLVFGAQNSTVLTSGDGKPSLVLPGNGFLNNAAKNEQRTFEFWANIQSNAVQERRVFGPLGSSDGLYVNKHLLILKVGTVQSSYSVGEWGRPMLISIRVGRSEVSMLINGERVASMKKDTSSYTDVDNDWLGFFAYKDVPVIQVESPAVYSYEVASIVQKRRFVYGQGVDFPTTMNGFNKSEVVLFDYSVSGASKNVRYPETSPWSSGVSENLNPNENSLSLADYPLPIISFEDPEIRPSWEEVMWAFFDPNDPSFSLKGVTTEEVTPGYVYFENLSFLNETPQAVFGVFSASDITSRQTLIRLINEISGSAFEAYIENGKVIYSLDGEIFDSSQEISAGTKFVAGVDFVKAQSFGGSVASFLSSSQSLKMIVAGNQNYSYTFSGDIYRVCASSKNNLSKISDVFNDSGLPIVQDAAQTRAMLETASYTLVAKSSLSGFTLDIATQASWQDYVPLSYFAKNVKDSANKEYKALDFLQFNVDYVKLNNFNEDGQYDTSYMPVKTYVAFDYLANGVSPIRASVAKLNKSSIVQPGAEWQTTRYEVLNDTIIKFPRGVDKFALGIVIYVEVDSPGIFSENIQIRSLGISSWSLGNQPNKINTVGAPMIPYKKSGNYFEYKDVPPWSLSKDTSPYLHLTKYKGARVRVPFSNAGIEGLYNTINPSYNITDEGFFKIDLVQMALRYDEQEFPTSPVQLFEIETPNENLRFYVTADSSSKKRGQIYAIDSRTSSLRSDIVFYVNGRATMRPILTPSIWTALSFSFLDALDFSNGKGYFRITSPILFDNISYYHQTQDSDVQRFSFRKWAAVRSGIDTTNGWEYWKDSTWQEVLFLAESDSELSDAEMVYNTFTGTNSFIFESEKGLLLKNYRSSVYKNLNWDNFVITPV